MSERILDSYFDRGLLQLNGNDAWFDKITKAADALATELRSDPKRLVSFVYSALDPRDLEDDPARADTLVILKRTWRTFSSVSMGPLDMVLRGVMLDAIVQNSRADNQTKLVVALLLASALPRLELHAEAKVWRDIMVQLTDEIQNEAEAKWSVPGQLPLPRMNSDDAPSLTLKLGALKVDIETLEAEMEAAAGPQNRENQPTDGNPNWTNAAPAWSHEFAPRAATAIGNVVSVVAGQRKVTINTDTIVDFVEQSVQSYVEDVAEQLVSSAKGVDLRSRLLWWKEAMVSPSATVDYVNLDDSVAAVLMALDYQAMLPALAPVSVTSFLRQAVRQVERGSSKRSLGDHVNHLSKAPELAAFREKLEFSGSGLVPLVSLFRCGASADMINERTVFSADASISCVDLAATIFLEAQAIKAVSEISAVAPGNEESEMYDKADQDHDEVA